MTFAYLVVTPSPDNQRITMSPMLSQLHSGQFHDHVIFIIQSFLGYVPEEIRRMIAFYMTPTWQWKIWRKLAYDCDIPEYPQIWIKYEQKIRTAIIEFVNTMTLLQDFDFTIGATVYRSHKCTFHQIHIIYKPLVVECINVLLERWKEDGIFEHNGGRHIINPKTFHTVGRLWYNPLTDSVIWITRECYLEIRQTRLELESSFIAYVSHTIEYTLFSLSHNIASAIQTYGHRFCYLDNM